MPEVDRRYFDRVQESMVEAAMKALALTADDVKTRAARDAGFAPEEELPHLRDSFEIEVLRVGDELQATITNTAGHAATQEIGGRWQSKFRRGRGGKFIKYRNHPAGGKERFLGDALKFGVRKYRGNLQKVIKADLKAKHGAR